MHYINGWCRIVDAVNSPMRVNAQLCTNVFGTSDSKYYRRQSLWDEWRHVLHCPTDWWAFLWTKVKNANKSVDKTCNIEYDTYLLHRENNPWNWGWGEESSPFKFQPTGWRLMKMSIEHILGYAGWLWCEMMQWTIVQLSPKPQIMNANRAQSVRSPRAARSPLCWSSYTTLLRSQRMHIHSFSQYMQNVGIHVVCVMVIFTSCVSVCQLVLMCPGYDRPTLSVDLSCRSAVKQPSTYFLKFKPFLGRTPRRFALLS